VKTATKRSKTSKETDTSAITAIFAKTKEAPQLVTGLQYFLAKEISISDFTSSTSERKKLKEALKIVNATLVLLASEMVVAQD
jgi:hypothetical protein